MTLLDLTPEQAHEAWEEMNTRALNTLRFSEQEHGFDPVGGEELELIKAGMALGISAAAEFYKEKPEYLPS